MESLAPLMCHDLFLLTLLCSHVGDVSQRETLWISMVNCLLCFKECIIIIQIRAKRKTTFPAWNGCREKLGQEQTLAELSAFFIKSLAFCFNSWFIFLVKFPNINPYLFSIMSLRLYFRASTVLLYMSCLLYSAKTHLCSFPVCA